MDKTLVVLSLLVALFSGMAFAEREQGICYKVLKHEVSTWQRDTQFFKIRSVDNTGQAVIDRSDAMLVLQDALGELDLTNEQCSSELWWEVEAVRFQLDNYFFAQDEMRKIRDASQTMDLASVPDKKRDIEERFKKFYTDRGVAYGTFVLHIVNLEGSLGLRPEFD